LSLVAELARAVGEAVNQEIANEAVVLGARRALPGDPRHEGGTMSRTRKHKKKAKDFETREERKRRERERKHAKTQGNLQRS
jgi:hypothetical protein